MSWMRERDPDKNHIQVSAPSSVVNQADISYGIRHVLVPITAAGKNTAITFVLTNVKAQPTIGLARFTIESAGGPGDDLKRVKGIARPKDADDATITDEYMLLGHVYHDTNNDSDDDGTDDTDDMVANNDGLIRLEVVAGAGGTGEATLADIVQSDEGLREYLNEAGDAIESVRKVHAGDTGVYLVFKYAPVETIEDGALRFTVPSDWSMPQEESSNQAGYTTVAGYIPEFNNRTITIPIVQLASGSSIEIHYGSGSLGAEAPKVKKTSEFLFAEKGTSGTFSNIGAVEVDVRSQASGRGSASIAATERHRRCA